MRGEQAFSQRGIHWRGRNGEPDVDPCVGGLQEGPPPSSCFPRNELVRAGEDSTLTAGSTRLRGLRREPLARESAENSGGFTVAALM
jgi:hypothetical protein